MCNVHNIIANVLKLLKILKKNFSRIHLKIVIEFRSQYTIRVNISPSTVHISRTPMKKINIFFIPYSRIYKINTEKKNNKCTMTQNLTPLTELCIKIY